MPNLRRYLSYSTLVVETCREGNPDIKRFDCSVFDGQYVAGKIDGEYLQRLENSRNDSAKHKRNKERADALAENEAVDLHNAN